MNCLDLDYGNSQIKYRLLDEAIVIADGLLDLDAEFTLPHLSQTHLSQTQLSQIQLSLQQLSRIRISSVVNSQLNQQLIQWCQHNFKIEPEFARVKPESQGLKGVYPEIGVDRWLAMLASLHHSRHTHSQQVMVVDCGTATTIDCIGTDGRHIGGYIVPGITKLRQSLKQTGLPLSQTPEPYSATLGNSTESCIDNGCLRMTLSIINEIWIEQSKETTTCLFITGGASVLILEHLAQIQPNYRKDLVLEGLALALP